MRYVDLSLTPEGWFGAPDEAVFTDPDLDHGPVYQANLLPDGTAIFLYELRGDPARIESILAEHDEDVITYQTSRVDSGTLVYSHGYPRENARDLLRLAQTSRIVVDPPMEFAPDGTLRVTVVGDEDAIREVFANAPEAVSVAVERTGEYEPGLGRLFSTLTERQREILRTAVELGYYREPRGASYEDVAEVVGCTAANVGEHLRRIEARVFEAVVP